MISDRHRHVLAIVAGLVLALFASACSSSADDATTETTAVNDAGQQDETNSDSAADADGASGTDTDAGTNTDTDEASDDTASTGPAPLSAAEAIEVHGALEQPWTGPLTEELLCEEFPTEHVLAVLGITEDRFELDASRGCSFQVDGDDYRASLLVRTLENEQDWNFLRGDVGSSDRQLTLDVADQGVTSDGDRPRAGVRDGSIGWLVATNGVNSPNPIFEIDAVLMQEFMTILTTRFSFSTQQGDVTIYRGPEDTNEPQESADGDNTRADDNTDTDEAASGGSGSGEIESREEIIADLSQFAPLLGWTDDDVACLADEALAVAAGDPDSLTEEDFFNLYVICDVLEGGLIVAASQFLTEGDGECLVAALSPEEIQALAEKALLNTTPEEATAAFDAAIQDHPECLN